MGRPHDIILRLKHRPRWLVVFLVLQVLLAGCELAMDPVFREATFERLPSTATEEDRAALTAMLDGQLPVRLAFLPARNLAGWGFFALCLYYTALAFRPPGPLRVVQVFVLEVWAETGAVLGSVATVLKEWITPQAAERFVNAPPLSLLDLAPATGNLELEVLLGALSPFSLLYLAVLTRGVARLCGFPTRKALLVVLGVWGVTLLLQAGALAGLRDLLHLAV